MMSISSPPSLVGMPVAKPRREASARAAVSPRVWAIVTCLLLGLSGGIRFWRESRFSTLSMQSAICPIPMSELPRTLGTWEFIEGTDTQLDPDIVRIAGATDHVLRSYFDRESGERASVLSLYGLGVDVYPHVPAVCYPAAGYKLFKGPIDFPEERVSGLKGPVRYRWAVYTKQIGSVNKYVEVFHAFLHDGEWLADATPRWKQFRTSPGLYKIQIEHTISSFGQDGKGPCLPLLLELARQISERLGRGPGRSGRGELRGRVGIDPEGRGSSVPSRSRDRGHPGPVVPGRQEAGDPGPIGSRRQASGPWTTKLTARATARTTMPIPPTKSTTSRAGIRYRAMRIGISRPGRSASSDPPTVARRRLTPSARAGTDRSRTIMIASPATRPLRQVAPALGPPRAPGARVSPSRGAVADRPCPAWRPVTTRARRRIMGDGGGIDLDVRPRLIAGPPYRVRIDLAMTILDQESPHRVAPPETGAVTAQLSVSTLTWQ